MAVASGRGWAIVDRQSAHMNRVLYDLLVVVRFVRGKLQLGRRYVSINECISEVVEAVHSLVVAARLTLRIELPAEPLYVDADPERLVQILDNLLRNAVCYTEAGGTIEVCVHREQDSAVMTVSDTGIGMEPAKIEALFEPYRQADPDRPGGGLGLGLTLVKHLVKMHGGTVVARSEGLGAGSEFEVTIPLAEEAPAESAEPIELPPPRRILVVDDEVDVADMFAATLESLGQDVTVVHSGAEALEAVGAQRPEIAFLDLHMPGMDGDALARRLRANAGSNGMCLVALSGFGLESRTKGDDFDHHLLKPVSVEAVVTLLHSLTA
jgi:CheY-like chemotaxis protein/anti-sigma regulatory factor (Ser/Thr protein kinase)